MLTYPKHGTYCDSGFEWLGEIPEDWQTIRAKYVLREIDERSRTGNEELLSVSHLTGVTPRSEKNVNMFLAEDYTGAKLCQPNDVVVNTMWAWMGALGVSPMEGLVSPSYGVYRPNEKVFPKFLDSLLRTPQYIAEYIRRSTGIHSSRLRLYPDQFLDIPLVLPPSDEQKRIVEFIDRKTSEIDQAIVQKQRLIELLQEQKAIVINRAVTKGLNPNVPMCDSGIDWIGGTPKHWIVSRIGFHGSVTKLTGFEYTDHWCVDEKGEIIALRGFNIGVRKLNLENSENISRGLSSQLRRSKLFKGDLVVPCTGTLGNAAVIQEDDKYHINQNIAKIQIERDILPDFLCYWMTSNLFKQKIDQNNVSGMQPVLLIGDIRKLQVVVPPISEQQEIIEKLNQVNEEIDSLIAREKRLIELLDVFRKSCIASAVTGKIKV